jgi:hypothetical protein
LKPLVENLIYRLNSGVANTWSNDRSPLYFTSDLVA